MADNQSPRTEFWANGATYEAYIGRWSRQVARELLPWLNVPAGCRWLDVGCGTGGLSQTILELTEPQAVTGIDRSEAFIAYAHQHIPDERARFEVGDAQALPWEAGGFEAVVSGLMLNFVPEPHRAVSEMARVARPGGTVAAYVWDYTGQMQMLRHFWDAAAALNPDAAELDEGPRFLICQPAPLRKQFEDAGLRAIEVRAIDIATNFQNFDDFWNPFLGGQGPAPSYVMSLNEEHRARLRERLRAALPFALDGSIPLVARAWAVRGVRS